jgi:hypothetical protein
MYLVIQQTISGIGKKARLDAAATLLPPEREDQEQQKQMEVTRKTGYGFVVSERQPLLFEGGALRPYQLDGLDWLKVLCTYTWSDTEKTRLCLYFFLFNELRKSARISFKMVPF